MSIFVDLEIRNKLISHLYSLGTDDPDVKNRSLDLSAFGYGFTTAPLYMNEGEKTSDSLPEDREWIEHFLVKSPQIIYTQGDCGISSKDFVFTIWVKTDRNKGTFYNEMISGLIEEHFPNNMHIPLDNGDTLTVVKSYQQASIIQDSKSGRLFNRVFVECENYFKNNNK